jgi:hypothetical protein
VKVSRISFVRLEDDDSNEFVAGRQSQRFDDGVAKSQQVFDERVILGDFEVRGEREGAGADDELLWSGLARRRQWPERSAADRSKHHGENKHQRSECQAGFLRRENTANRRSAQRRQFVQFNVLLAQHLPRLAQQRGSRNPVRTAWRFSTELVFENDRD